MNITIDIGNSRVKFYTFTGPERFEKIYEGTPEGLDPAGVLSNLAGQKNGILVNTGTIPDGWLESFRETFTRFIHLGPETPLPVENRYQSKETLGYDRIAAVVGAQYLFPRKNVLVIDAGTAMTFDLVTSEGVYPGGIISPGIEMRFRALADYTAGLPKLGIQDHFPLIGNETQSAIASGVQNGILAETEGIIERFQKQYAPLTIVLTGGNRVFFDKNLKSSIFVRPDLVAIGLNRILVFNEGI